MTARSTAEAAINGIGKTERASQLSNEQSNQSVADALHSNVGYRTDGSSSSTSYDSALKTVRQNDVANRLANEVARQATKDAQRESLRNANDFGSY